MKSKISAVPAVLVAVLVTVSCVSFEIDEIGEFGQVIEFRGVKILTDDGADAMVAAVLRNDNPYEVEISYRAIGGEIGNRTSSGSSAMTTSGSSRITAAWNNSDGIGVLEPGEEILVTSLLSNWHLYNRPFTSRIEIVVDAPEPRSRLKIYFGEDEVFTDAMQISQENRMGRNDPSRYNSRSSRFGELPRGYDLTIPE